MMEYNLWRHRRDLSEIGRMYLIVIGLFLAGLLVWELAKRQGPPWQPTASANAPPSLQYAP